MEVNRETGKNISKSLITTIKKISIDKWILMGLAGLVLVLCSDSCSGSSGDKLSSDNGNSGVSNSSYGTSSDSDSLNISSGTDSSLDTYIDSLESQLEEILSSVDGVGRVNVMITLKGSSTKEVLMEEPYTESLVDETDSEGGVRNNSEKSQDYRVIYEENGDGGTVPFVISETTPDIAGVAVVAEGGDSAAVKEKITSIIKALFGIEINKIAVGKMK